MLSLGLLLSISSNKFKTVLWCIAKGFSQSLCSPPPTSKYGDPLCFLAARLKSLTLHACFLKCFPCERLWSWCYALPSKKSLYLCFSSVRIAVSYTNTKLLTCINITSELFLCGPRCPSFGSLWIKGSLCSWFGSWGVVSTKEKTRSTFSSFLFCTVMVNVSIYKQTAIQNTHLQRAERSQAMLKEDSSMLRWALRSLLKWF